VNDADLVARARHGDAAAFGELVDRHRTAVYRAALAALRSHAEAEDAAQDAFLLAYRRLKSFRGEASFKTWLLTIAWHQAINRRRALSRIWRRIADTSVARSDEEAATHDAVLASIAATGLSPEAAAAHEQLRRSVHRAIGGLSPKLRDALVLAQSGEYSYEEIGSMLKVPVGTIKWRVSEARRLVKQRLQLQGFGDGR
jgi:RNA polymerase sigma-70 factor (ECF subfamily)